MSNKGTIGLIEKIESYRVNDGPGIRTAVFFMGCPLRCTWCANPETWEKRPRLLANPDLCTGCNKCIDVCPVNALSLVDKKIKVQRDICTECGKCAQMCLFDALRMVGKEISVDELTSELLKDEPFFESSNGGVTITGGEPTVQIDFLENLCKALKENYVSIALDTCGFFTQQNFNRISEYLDCVLYDIKLSDSEKHKHYTGKDNHTIIENLRYIDSFGIPIIIRLIIIGGTNDTYEEINEKIKLLKELNNVMQVDLLPYHRLGVSKYTSLGMVYSHPEFVKPEKEVMESIKNKFQKALGVPCTIGG